MNLDDYDFDRLLGLGYTEKATGDLKKACWSGYTAVGTKQKGGKTVPNCVPISKSKSDHAESEEESLADGRIQPTKKRRPFIFGPSAGSPSFAEGEEETLDFATCQRPDGSMYGTAGTCRKGSQVSDDQAALQRAMNRKRKTGRVGGTLKKKLQNDEEHQHLSKLHKKLEKNTESARANLKKTSEALESDRWNPEKKAAYKKAQQEANAALTASEKARSDLKRRERDIARQHLEQNQAARGKPTKDRPDWADEAKQLG